MNYENNDNFMGKFGYGNPVVSDSYLAGDSFSKNDKVVQNDFKADSAYLDNLLNQFDGEKRKEIIEILIKDRESLRTKMLYEIENIKDNMRTMNYQNRYKINQVMPFRDLAKLYAGLNQCSVEEEIKAWKDISFLRIKLFDEGLTGGVNYEKQQI